MTTSVTKTALATTGGVYLEQNGQQVQTLLGQRTFCAAPSAALADETRRLELPQPRGEDVGRDSLLGAQEVAITSVAR